MWLVQIILKPWYAKILKMTLFSPTMFRVGHVWWTPRQHQTLSSRNKAMMFFNTQKHNFTAYLPYVYDVAEKNEDKMLIISKLRFPLSLQWWNCISMNSEIALIMYDPCGDAKWFLEINSSPFRIYV